MYLRIISRGKSEKYSDFPYAPIQKWQDLKKLINSSKKVLWRWNMIKMSICKPIFIIFKKNWFPSFWVAWRQIDVFPLFANTNGFRWRNMTKMSEKVEKFGHFSFLMSFHDHKAGSQWIIRLYLFFYRNESKKFRGR